MPFGTVRLYIRELRNKRLITTGARGVNAPDMTPMDAARVTIAILGTDKPAHSADVVTDIGNLTVNRSYSKGDVPKFAKDLNYAVSLEEMLEEFFTYQSNLSLAIRSIEVCRESREASVKFQHGEACFDADYSAQQYILESGESRGRQTIVRLKSSDLLELAGRLNISNASKETKT